MKVFFKFIICSLILSIILSILYIRFRNDNFSLFGFNCLRVLTGSMAPTINAGEIIIIKRCNEYKIGDIVTYRTKDDYLITHRIISIEGDMYYTKGDYNNVQDLEPISINQVCGKVIYHYKSVFSNLITSFAKFLTSSKIKLFSEIAKPIFNVIGDKEISIKQYGSINNYHFSVRNYNENQISDIDLIYRIEVLSENNMNYKLLYDNEEINTNQIFELNHKEKQEHRYTLKIEAPEDYEGKVKVNIYAYQKEG